MTRPFFFYAILFLSIPLYVNSPLGTDLFFLIALCALFFNSRMSAFFLCTVAAFFVDYFSPVKGVAVIAYTAGMGIALLLSRYMVTTHSFFSFFLLGFFSWAGMVTLKALIFFIFSSIAFSGEGGQSFGLRDGASVAYTFGVVLLFFVFVYPALSYFRHVSDERYTLPL